jgi:hypothetical protein
MALSEKELEALAVKHEEFGFGQVDPGGFTTHGFGPDGLRAFIAEVRKDDEALIRQMLEHLDVVTDEGQGDEGWQSQDLKNTIAAANARLGVKEET